MLVLGGSWSAYWYNGHIYSSEISRGLDIFELTPTKFLTQNEIDAARSVQVAELNVQNQQKIVWPKNKAVALAYIDQIERSGSLAASEIAKLRNAVESKSLDQTQVAKLKSMLEKNAVRLRTGLTRNDFRHWLRSSKRPHYRSFGYARQKLTVPAARLSCGNFSLLGFSKMECFDLRG